MHILFIHQNFPAQFGHIAEYLVQRKGFRCTFVSQQPPGKDGGIERIQYAIRGGATRADAITAAAPSRTPSGTPTPSTRPCTRATTSSPTWSSPTPASCSPCSCASCMTARSSTISNTIITRAGPTWTIRPDFPYPAINVCGPVRATPGLLLDLEDCDAGYSPTRWQRSLLPATYRHERCASSSTASTRTCGGRCRGVPRRVGDRIIPDDVRIVTYVSRGMESIRGFDIFMQTARLLCQRRKDVLFVVVGEDRVCYGGDQEVTGGKRSSSGCWRATTTTSRVSSSRA